MGYGIGHGIPKYRAQEEGKMGDKGRGSVGECYPCPFRFIYFSLFYFLFFFFFLKNFSSPHKRLCYHTSLYLCPHGLGIGIANIGR